MHEPAAPSILSALVQGPLRWRGQGLNEAQEAFEGTLELLVLEAGRALLLRYVATLADGSVVHTESTLLGPGPDGRLCLWPLMAELPGVLVHAELHTRTEADGGITAVFASGPRDEASVFREELTLQTAADGSLVYAHAWGLPGGPFEARSSCRLWPSAA